MYIFIVPLVLRFFEYKQNIIIIINPPCKANDPNLDVQNDHRSVYHKKRYKFHHVLVLFLMNGNE